jgi:hypothetical protein
MNQMRTWCSHFFTIQINFGNTLLYSFCSLHVLILFCYSFKLSNLLSRDNLLGGAISTYGDFSGAANNYGFFAPSVASEVRARFTVQLKDGQILNDSIYFKNDEMNLRISTMYIFCSVEEARDPFSRSLGAYVLSRYRNPQKVTVNLEQISIPTMTEFRTGKRIAWELFYSSSFEMIPNQ